MMLVCYISKILPVDVLATFAHEQYYAVGFSVWKMSLLVHLQANSSSCSLEPCRQLELVSNVCNCP